METGNCLLCHRKQSFLVVPTPTHEQTEKHRTEEEDREHNQIEVNARNLGAVHSHFTYSLKGFPILYSTNSNCYREVATVHVELATCVAD